MNLNYYQAGCRAYREGREIADNEYTPGNMPQREWREGWLNEQKIQTGDNPIPVSITEGPQSTSAPPHPGSGR